MFFCSNKAGRHGTGDAKLALRWGLKGSVYWFIGKTYGILTKNGSIKTLGLGKIRKYVTEFIEFVQSKSDLTFLVTEITCVLADYKPENIAPLFEKAVDLLNIHLPESFWKILEK